MQNTKKSNKTNTLLSLTTAALALPGMTPQSAMAQAVTEDTILSYRYSQYAEGEIDGSVNVVDGSRERYDISIHQLRFKTAIAGNADMTVDLQQESMSGASPWYILQGNDGEPLLVMSGATIEEERTDIGANFTSYFDTIVSSTSLGYSTENDYSSFSMSYALSKALNEKNVTLDFRISGSQDFIEPTPIGGDARTIPIDEEKKTSGSLSFGFSAVIDRTSILSTAISLTRYDGYLSDPYKRVHVLNLPETSTGENDNCPAGLCADSRPDQRTQWDWTVRYRKSLTEYNAALHLDYRYYTNDWEVDSHTVEAAWYQNFAEHWQVAPQVRWYTQTDSAFYQIYFENPRNDGFYSSDYRLSAFDAVSAKLKLSRFFGFGALHVSFETYSSDAGTGRNELSAGSPALVDFTHVTAGIDYKF